MPIVKPKIAWRCKACGQVFEDTNGGKPPIEHGVLVIRIGESAVAETCRGTLEVIPDDWDENIRRWENGI